jgi:hypothetical protein
MMKTSGKTKSAAPNGARIAWTPVSHIINVPANEAEYNELVAALDMLLDTSDPDEESPASALIDIIGDLIESYENANIPEPSALREKTRSRPHRAPSLRLHTA